MIDNIYATTWWLALDARTRLLDVANKPLTLLLNYLLRSAGVSLIIIILFYSGFLLRTAEELMK